MKTGQKYTPFIILFGIVLILLIVFISNNKNLPKPANNGDVSESMAIFTRTSFWGPCTEENKCTGTLSVYTDNTIVQQTGTDEPIIKTLTDMQLTAIMEAIRETDVMNKECEKEIEALDYSQTVTISLDGITKMFTFETCRKEIGMIEDTIQLAAFPESI